MNFLKVNPENETKSFLINTDMIYKIDFEDNILFAYTKPNSGINKKRYIVSEPIPNWIKELINP